jgi:hypothetical protein
MQMFNRFVVWLQSGTPRQLARWERERSKGPRHFILYRGLFMFGGYMWVMLTLSSFFQTRRLKYIMDQMPGSHSAFIPVHFFFQLLVPTTAICIGGGVVFGAVVWRLAEWQYRRNTQRSLSATGARK